MGTVLFLRFPEAGPGPLTRQRDGLLRRISGSTTEVLVGGMYVDMDLCGAMGIFLSIEGLGINRWVDVTRLRATWPVAQPVTTPAVLEDIAVVEGIIGYFFNDKRLVIEALTPKNVAVPDLERLEYLGDAVLDVTAQDF